MSRVITNAGVGAGLRLTMIPDSALKTLLDTWDTADTTIAGKKLVKLTFADDFEVTDAGDNEIPDGLIVDVHKVNGSPYYYLTVELFSYVDQNSNRHTPRKVIQLPYSGTIALQDSVIVNGSSAENVDDGGTGGWGAVVAKDVPTSGYVQVLF